MTALTQNPNSRFTSLVIRNLVKEYVSGKPVLKSISLTFDKSELVAIIGPSGTGKSTLIRCVNRLVEPTSGAILLFPNWDTTRELMAEANLVHGIVAVAFMAASLGHIYIGSVGMQGAFQGMRTGVVDEAWAKQHHELWYNDMKSGKPSTTPIGAAQPAAGDD